MNEETVKQEDDILYTILKKYSDKDESVSTDDFIRQELSASGQFSKDEVEEIVKTISDTISSNSNNFREIQEYKKKGKTTSLWFRDLLENVTSDFSPTAKSSLITSIKDSLNKGNLELASEWTGQETDEIVRPLETDNFTDHYRNIIAENLTDELKINAHIRTAVTEEIMCPESGNEGKENDNE
jgi:hypothetical protein